MNTSSPTQWHPASSPLIDPDRAQDRSGSTTKLRIRKRWNGTSIIWGSVFIYGLLFFADALFRPNLELFGVHDAELEKMVFARWGKSIVWEQVKLLTVMLFVGALVGIGARWLIVLWRRALGKQPIVQGKRFFFSGMGLGILVHISMMAMAIAKYPSLYVESLYSRGGIRKQGMFFLTHHVGLHRLEMALLLFWGLLFVLPFFFPATLRSIRKKYRAVRSILPPFAQARGGYLGFGALCLLLFATAGFVHFAMPFTSSTKSPLSTQPSVLILAIDSLRSDQLNDKKRTPNLQRLAEKSVQFDAAFVSLPRTFPSWVTLLTGKYAHHHGIRTMFPTPKERASMGPMMAHNFKERGYQTQVISDFAGEIFTRFDAGFAHTQVPVFDAHTIIQQIGITVHPNVMAYVTGSQGRFLFPGLNSLAELSDPTRMADQTIEALTKQKDKPFFMVSFFSTAHFPYAAPEPEYHQFGNPTYKGAFLYHKPPLDTPGSRADEEQIRALYQAAVFSIDKEIARILDALKASGQDKNTIVVVLADHGENLYDVPGRGMGHGDHLEGSKTTHIPLLVYDPIHAFHAHHVPGIVRDIDLTPTLLHLTNAQQPDLTLDGVDLFPLLVGEKASLDLPSFGETGLWFITSGPGFEPKKRLPYSGVLQATVVDDNNDISLKEACKNRVIQAKHRSLRTDQYKLIYRPTTSGVIWSLYDIKKDPDELSDLIANPAYAQPAETLKNQLRTFLAQDPGFSLLNDFLIPKERTSMETCTK